MNALALLATMLGLSLTSGVNLYATVGITGLAIRLGWVDSLPGGLEVLGSWWVIGIALTLYLIEFLADKIPAIDSAWDSIHTFIRPIGAALLGLAAVGEMDPVVQVCVALICGSLALSTHSLKAGGRLVVNTSPEPFSNVAVSLAEDVVVAGVTGLVIFHPVLSLAITFPILLAVLYFVPKVYRFLWVRFKAVAHRLAGGEPPVLPVPQTLPETVQQKVGEPARAVPVFIGRLKGFTGGRKAVLIVGSQGMGIMSHGTLRNREAAWLCRDLDSVSLVKGLFLDRLEFACDGVWGSVLSYRRQRPRMEQVVREISGGSNWETEPRRDPRPVLAGEAPPMRGV